MRPAGVLQAPLCRRTAETSVNNIAVAAYQDGYQGIGGYAYKHYLQVLKTSPLPWTSCAFIAYMTTTNEGFAAWGKDMGGYSATRSAGRITLRMVMWTV